MGTVLFVYGTLKRGERNHRLIADQRFLGPAVSAPKYRVLDLGPHPGLIPDANEGLSIAGELWDVSNCTLEELDDFEGLPDLFDRRVIELIGESQSVQAYFWVRAIPKGVASGARWPLR